MSHPQLSKDTEAIFKAIPGCYLILAADAPTFTVLAASDAYLRATKTTRTDLVGKGIRKISAHNPEDYTENSAKALDESLKYVMQYRQPHAMKDLKFDVTAPDGKLDERYWRPTHSPVLDDKGKVSYIIHRILDVTRETQAARSERQYLDALANKDVPVGVNILRGPEFVVEFANPIICQMWDRTPDQIIGRPLLDVLPSIKGQGFEDLLEGVLKTGIPYIGNGMPAELERHGRKEKTFFDFVYSPLRDSHGRITGIMTIATESTERVIASQQVADERKRLYEVLMQAPFGIAILNGPEHCIELANPDVCEIWGKTHDKVIGKPLLEALPEVKGQGFDTLLTKVMKTAKTHYGKETPVKLERQGKAEEIFVNFVYTPLRTASGEVTGVMAAAVDVTEQVQARQAVEASEERFRTLIEQSTDAVQLIDVEGNIIYSSESVLTVLGYTPEELAGKNVSPFIHPNDIAQFTKQVTELSETPGLRMHFEYRVRHKSGAWIWLETTGVNRLHDPKIRALVGNFRDITERKHLERQKDDFIGIATHELKTPVTSIKTYAQILERRFKKSGQTEDYENMNKITSQIDKLTNLIGDLLDITKIESDQLQLHPATFSFDKLVKNTVDTLQPTTKRHHLNISGATHTRITSDKDRLEQVLVNLISNAIKYSPHTQEIEIELAKGDGTVTARVRDFGIGIDKKRQPHVFERFYRVSGPNLESYPGLGLGLYISAEIIKRLGGKIWVESDGKNGSTFSVELPLHSSDSGVKTPESQIIAEVSHE